MSSQLDNDSRMSGQLDIYSQMYPPIEASSGQDWHKVAKYYGFNFFSHLMFSHWRGKPFQCRRLCTIITTTTKEQSIYA